MNFRIPVLSLLIGIGVIACKQQLPSDLTKENLIPKPVSVSATSKTFELTNKTGIYLEGESSELQFVGQYLADRLKPSTGFDLPVSTTKGEPGSGSVYLALTGTDAELGEEGDRVVEVLPLPAAGQEEGLADREAGQERSQERECGRHLESQLGGAFQGGGHGHLNLRADGRGGLDDDGRCGHLHLR